MHSAQGSNGFVNGPARSPTAGTPVPAWLPPAAYWREAVRDSLQAGNDSCSMQWVDCVAEMPCSRYAVSHAQSCCAHGSLLARSSPAGGQDSTVFRQILVLANSNVHRPCATIS